jgi:hypothetical protein
MVPKKMGGLRLVLFLLLWGLHTWNWASASLAAEPPVAPLARAAALGAQAPMQIPFEQADGDEPQGQVIEAVPGMIMSDSSHEASDSAVAPAGSLGPAGMLPTIQSRILSPAELVSESSAAVGCSQQSGMESDHDCREDTAEGPLPAYPQR